MLAAIPQLGSQVLRCRSRASPRLPPFAKHHLPGPQARKPALGSGRAYQGDRFRVCEARAGYHLDVVWDAGLSSVLLEAAFGMRDEMS